MVQSKTVDNKGGVWKISALDKALAEFFVVSVSWAYDSILDVDLLKESLSDVLSFYPILAGRVDRTCAFVNLNNAGVAFEVIAHQSTNKSVKEITSITTTYRDFGFLPGSSFLAGTNRPLLSIQAHIFKDGTVLSCSVTHMVADGSTAFMFMGDWARLALARRSATAHVGGGGGGGGEGESAAAGGGGIGSLTYTPTLKIIPVTDDSIHHVDKFYDASMSKSQFSDLAVDTLGLHRNSTWMAVKFVSKMAARIAWLTLYHGVTFARLDTPIHISEDQVKALVEEAARDKTVPFLTVGGAVHNSSHAQLNYTPLLLLNYTLYYLCM